MTITGAEIAAAKAALHPAQKLSAAGWKKLNQAREGSKNYAYLIGFFEEAVERAAAEILSTDKDWKASSAGEVAKAAAVAAGKDLDHRSKWGKKMKRFLPRPRVERGERSTLRNLNAETTDAHLRRWFVVGLLELEAHDGGRRPDHVREALAGRAATCFFDVLLEAEFAGAESSGYAKGLAEALSANSKVAEEHKTEFLGVSGAGVTGAALAVDLLTAGNDAWLPLLVAAVSVVAIGVQAIRTVLTPSLQDSREASLIADNVRDWLIDIADAATGGSARNHEGLIDLVEDLDRRVLPQLARYQTGSLPAALQRVAGLAIAKARARTSYSHGTLSKELASAFQLLDLPAGRQSVEGVAQPERGGEEPYRPQQSPGATAEPELQFPG